MTSTPTLFSSVKPAHINLHKTLQLRIPVCISSFSQSPPNLDKLIPLKDKMNNAPEGTYGPHGSRLANAADPCVDSDNDNRGPMSGNGVGTNYPSSIHG